MTAQELITKQTQQAGRQLHQALDAIPEDQVDTKPLPNLMSVREILVHLCETYTAVKATAQGEKHSWGSYSPGVENYADLRALFDRLRQEAVEMALASENGVEILSDFVVAHDFYHVGQLVTGRLSYDPAWDSYAIYG